MSKQWLRYFVVAMICGVLPLLPSSSAAATASTPPASAAVAVPALYGVDAALPTMQRASDFEARAQVRTYQRSAASRSSIVNAPSNPRLFREVFGFAFASSLGDPTIGYPSWNFGLLSTVAYFGIHVDWTGDFSGGSAFNTWNNPNGPVPGFIQTAHASGTKVVLTIAMFDSTSGTPNMCSALQRSNVTIQRTVAEIQAKG